MPMDGLYLNRVVQELNSALQGARIDKIQQPEKDEILIQLRSRGRGGRTERLLMSSCPSYARLHLTDNRKESPATPPSFCTLLRKHLTGGTVLAVEQAGLDRIATIRISSYDDLGDPCVKLLVLEMTGRYTNLFLLEEGGRIIDCARHVSSEESRVRPVYPGYMYASPPSQNKLDPRTAPDDTLLGLVGSCRRPEGVLFDTFDGLSKKSAQEIAFRFYHKYPDCAERNIGEFSADALRLLVADVRVYTALALDPSTPCSAFIHPDTGVTADIFPCFQRQLDEASQRPYASPSALLDEHYREQDLENRIRQRGAHLSRTLKTNLERCRKKLAIQTEEIAAAGQDERWRLWGELLQANLHAVPRGAQQVELLNYYREDQAMELIPLQPSKSPAQNAQMYFKQYQKAKIAQRVLKDHITATREELAYLESVQQALETCSEFKDLEEIRQELIGQGYVRKPSRSKGQARIAPSSPRRYETPDGFEILVGRNNVQNDALTFKTAAPMDIWLHAQETPGSHVILRCVGKKPSEEALAMAAGLAAYYSKRNADARVAVDYTWRKHVKKPAGAKPGKVIYTDFSTLFAAPAELHEAMGAAGTPSS